MPVTVRKLMAAIALAGISVAASPPAFAQSSPVLGSWQVSADTPMGEMKSTMTFTESDDGYTVEIKDQPMAGAPGGGQPPEQTYSDLKIEGNSFSFKRSIVSEMGAFDLSYTGTVDGDTLEATADSDFGAVNITGARED